MPNSHAEVELLKDSELRSSKKITYILNFNDLDSTNFAEEQSELISFLQKQVPMKVTYQYQHAYNSIAIEVSGYNAWKLKEMPGIKYIYKVDENIELARNVLVNNVNARVLKILIRKISQKSLGKT